MRSLQEEGLQRMNDVTVFEEAKAGERVVLTFDLDFAEIAAVSRDRPVRVLLMRLRNTRSAHVIERLQAVIPACDEHLARSAVVLVEESRYRVRRLPIGRSGDPS